MSKYVRYKQRSKLHLGFAVLSHEEEVYQGLQNELVVPVLKNFLSLPLNFFRTQVLQT